MGGPSVLNLSPDDSMADAMSDPGRYRLEQDYTLADILEHPEYKGKIDLTYEYDHGDSWGHDITVLGRAGPALRSAMGGIPQKVYCIAGEGHPCAEDAGSYPVSGYSLGFAFCGRSGILPRICATLKELPS